MVKVFSFSLCSFSQHSGGCVLIEKLKSLQLYGIDRFEVPWPIYMCGNQLAAVAKTH